MADLPFPGNRIAINAYLFTEDIDIRFVVLSQLIY